MQQQIVYHNPNIQISSLEVPVGMVDGILTKLRNPVNHDLWLTGRFSSSVNHPLNESLLKEIEDSLGVGIASKRMTEMKAMLTPMFKSLPKNKHGNLEHVTYIHDYGSLL